MEIVCILSKKSLDSAYTLRKKIWIACLTEKIVYAYFIVKRYHLCCLLKRIIFDYIYIRKPRNMYLPSDFAFI